jgi:hypothetical protein
MTSFDLPVIVDFGLAGIAMLCLVTLEIMRRRRRPRRRRESSADSR